MKALLVFAACAPILAATIAWSAEPANTVTRATLHNGLQVVIVRDPLSPAVTTVMNYLVGSDEAPAGFPGMAHAQEHMMFRGSPNLSADQLADVAAGMGGKFNADTQQSVTQYEFSVPAQDLEVPLRIEAIRMSGVLDSEALWKQERRAIEQEVARDLSNPEYVFYKELLEAMFQGTPYQHDALGTKASFDQTTGAMLQKFHQTWYAPNNAVLVITGDVQPDAALAEVKKLFGQIPAKKLPPRPAYHFSAVRPQTLQLKTDLPYGLVVIAFRMPGARSSDYAVGQVLADVLDSRRGTLHDLAIQGKALAAEYSMDAFPHAGIGMAVAAFPAGADAKQVVKDLQAALAADATNGFPADLSAAAIRREATDLESQKDSISGLASEWSDALTVEGRSSPDENLEAIKRLSAADVNRAARQYLDPNHAVTAILTPQPSGKPISSHSFKGPESFTPTHVKPVILPAWAKAAVTGLTVPPSAVQPVVSTLPNGLRLIVQRETVADTVSIYGHIRNDEDMETPDGEEGVSDVLSGLLPYGSQNMGRLAFEKALDDIGATESAGTTFEARSLTAHFDRATQLLADNELHPALPAKDFEIIRKQVAGAVAGELSSPDFLAEQALRADLFPKKDPSLRHPTPAGVSALTMKDVRAYYQKVFRPDLTTIVVIGNVMPADARAVVEKYFGGWTASGPRPPTLLPAVPANIPKTTAVPDASRIQDKVQLAETLGLTRSNPDYYALQLGNHMLGGAFYATRLYRDLRETTGLAYYVSSDLDVGRTRGLYAVSFGCEPANVGKAAAIVRRDLKDMQTSPAPERDLLRAKALLLHEIPLSESSEQAIAEGLLSRSDKELPLDEPTRAARRYVALDAEQVRAAFQKWTRPDDLVMVTQGPAPK